MRIEAEADFLEIRPSVEAFIGHDPIGDSAAGRLVGYLDAHHPEITEQARNALAEDLDRFTGPDRAGLYITAEQASLLDALDAEELDDPAPHIDVEPPGLDPHPYAEPATNDDWKAWEDMLDRAPDTSISEPEHHARARDLGKEIEP